MGVLAEYERELEKILENIENNRVEAMREIASIIDRTVKEIEEEAMRIIRNIENRAREEVDRIEKQAELEKQKILSEIDKTAGTNYSRAVNEGVEILRKMILGEGLYQ